jgi:xanthine/uracil/vitamin C permease (AzgA family)
MLSLPWTMARLRRIALSVVAIGLASHAMGASSQELKIVLSGSQEIPPVTTTASGTAAITVNADKSVTGNATIAGITVTVAHIHEGAAGTNGPIIIPLVKTADNVWSLPPGARLSDSQYESYKAGNLYFNIHSEAHRSGEIRGQIKR